MNPKEQGIKSVSVRVVVASPGLLGQEVVYEIEDTFDGPHSERTEVAFNLDVPKEEIEPGVWRRPEDSPRDWTTVALTNSAAPVRRTVFRVNPDGTRTEVTA